MSMPARMGTGGRTGRERAAQATASASASRSMLNFIGIFPLLSLDDRFGDVAVQYLNVDAVAAQLVGDRFGHGDAAVAAADAPHRDGYGLAGFVDEVAGRGGGVRDDGRDSRGGQHVLPDGFVDPGQLPH